MKAFQMTVMSILVLTRMCRTSKEEKLRQQGCTSWMLQQTQLLSAFCWLQRLLDGNSTGWAS